MRRATLGLLLVSGCSAAPTTTCAYSEVSPSVASGHVECQTAHSKYGDMVLTVTGGDLDLDLLLSPSTAPPAVAFGVTMRSPATACPPTEGSWVTVDGLVVSAHLNCQGILVYFSVGL